jgi:hypothetical protein
MLARHTEDSRRRHQAGMKMSLAAKSRDEKRGCPTYSHILAPTKKTHSSNIPVICIWTLRQNHIDSIMVTLGCTITTLLLNIMIDQDVDLKQRFPQNTVYNSSLTCSSPLRSGIAIILTTKLVQPVKCCVRCPLPVSGLYCSHAKPVSFQLS